MPPNTRTLQDTFNDPVFAQSNTAQVINNQLGYRSVSAEQINDSVIYYSVMLGDNFDSSHNLVLPFRIPSTDLQPISITLDIYSQKYRSYAVNNNHTHSVTIPSHTHSVTVADHTHVVSISAHSHSLSGHTHSVSAAPHEHNLVVDDKVPGLGTYALQYTPSSTSAGRVSANFTGTGAGSVYEFGWPTDGYTSFSNNTSDSGTLTTTNSGGSSSPTSNNGGAQTVSSASGGGSTATSGSAVSLSYGIVEDTYPNNMGVIVDSTDISLNLGGLWNPATNSNHITLTGLNVTPYVINNSVNKGIHTLQLYSSQNGRAIVQIYIKCIVKN